MATREGLPGRQHIFATVELVKVTGKKLWLLLPLWGQGGGQVAGESRGGEGKARPEMLPSSLF
jgi:hypothetical protein